MTSRTLFCVFGSEIYSILLLSRNFASSNYSTSFVDSVIFCRLNFYHKSGCDDVSQFLLEIGLQHYHQLFLSHGVCKVDQLVQLNNRTLKEMGVKSSRERKVITGAVATLKKSFESSDPTSVTAPYNSSLHKVLWYPLQPNLISNLYLLLLTLHSFE